MADSSASGLTSKSSGLRITGETRVVGVIGHPIRHSLSPVIHNAGFRSTGIDYVYAAFDVAPGAAAEALQALKVLGLAGLSVTMPHKADVARRVDRLAESARHLDSVNTVEIAADGTLVGHSTDGDGLVESLKRHRIGVAGASIAVVGAGGAGRSVVDAMSRHGATRISIVNRTIDAARKAADLAPEVAVSFESGTPEAMSAISESDVVVNATSVGMSDSSSSAPVPFDTALLASSQTVVDLVYHPIETRLLRSAAERGCRTVDGLGMLVHQAALQQVIWTGVAPDVGEMTRAAAEALRVA